MMEMMNHGKEGAKMSHGMEMHKMSHGIAKGAAIAAGSHSGRSLMSKIVKHPLVLIGAGAVAGYLIHKYRREIVKTTSKVVDQGKDFVQQQKESLEDLVAESNEADESAETGK